MISFQPPDERILPWNQADHPSKWNFDFYLFPSLRSNVADYGQLIHSRSLWRHRSYLLRLYLQCCQSQTAVYSQFQRIKVIQKVVSVYFASVNGFFQYLIHAEVNLQRAKSRNPRIVSRIPFCHFAHIDELGHYNLVLPQMLHLSKRI